MKTSDFDYNLPHELIAQTPLENRNASKLLTVNRETGELNHKVFSDIIDMLDENDVLVLNNSRVYKARLIGVKEDTLAKIELFVLEMRDNICKCLTKPGRRVKIGTRVIFGDGLLIATCISDLGDGIKEYKVEYEGIFYEVLDKLGTIPLPPYITEKLDDSERYQTVYSKVIGSAAAPTAGLHFTTELMDKIREKNIQIHYVTLHVGLGTFRPVEVEDVKNHVMHSEYYIMTEETANALNKAKEENKRIVSVGTTTCRVLESNIENGKFVAKECYTNIFIYEGYEFKAIDCLITNFHLPKSTLLMLVSAFSTKEIIFNAYEEAIKNNYRFFSFGDAMFLYK